MTTSVKPNSKQYEILQFSKLPFLKNRLSGYSRREAILGNLKQFFEDRPRYSTTSAFLFRDDFNSPLQTDQWLIPFDNLIKAYLGQSIYDFESEPREGFEENGYLMLPKNPVIRKIGGAYEDKIQFFSKAYVIDSLDTVASHLTNPEYRGDILFLSPPKGKKADDSDLLWTSGQSLASDMRLRLPYEVTHFDSNQIKISVNVPGDKPAWIFYSDVWHPFWKATVNGKPRTIFKADLAYKAVQLNPGLNQVHFYFESKLISFLHAFFALHAVFWLGVLAWLISRICFSHCEKSLT